MKFKIASVVELAVPVSILVVISLSACGGGAYGTGSNAYDGRWTVVDTGYAIPTKLAGDDSVSCWEDFTFVTITHGYGSGTQYIHCEGNVTQDEALYGYPKYMNLGITVTPAASGITGTMMLVTTGGGGDYGSQGTQTSGACPSREFCGVPEPVKFDMWKCGSPAAQARGC